MGRTIQSAEVVFPVVSDDGCTCPCASPDTSTSETMNDQKLICFFIFFSYSLFKNSACYWRNILREARKVSLFGTSGILSGTNGKKIADLLRVGDCSGLPAPRGCFRRNNEKADPLEDRLFVLTELQVQLPGEEVHTIETLASYRQICSVYPF